MELLQIVFLSSFFVEGTLGIFGYTRTVYLTADTTSQTLTSPGYPSGYPPNVKILYVITAFDPDYRIALAKNDFEMEYTSSCAFDSFKVYDGIVSIYNHKGTFCGSSIDSNWFSTYDDVRLIFESDSSINRRGFSLEYYATKSDPFVDAYFSLKLGLGICGGVLFLVLVIVVCYCAVHKTSGRKQVGTILVTQSTPHVVGHPPPSNTMMVSTVHGYPHGATSQMAPPPPPYDSVDLYSGHVPPPFNYIPPNYSKPYENQIGNF